MPNNRTEDQVNQDAPQDRTPDPAQQPETEEQASSQASATEAQQPEDGQATDPQALRTEIEALQAENVSLQDRLARTLAEAENVRRRAEQERRDQARYGVAPLARELLPVADNLGRALDAVPAEARESSEAIRNLLLGVEMTAQQLQNALSGVGIAPIAPQPGEKFDYQIHQAISEAAGTGHPAGSVATVVQAGYRLHERLLRPAMVIVARADAAATPSDATPAPATGKDG